MQTSIGVEAQCGEGWRVIIEDAIAQLTQLGVRRDDYAAIKEKFGCLRIVLSQWPSMYNGPDVAADIIYAARARSYETCDVCSSRGLLRLDVGHIRTLCDQHDEEING